MPTFVSSSVLHSHPHYIEHHHGFNSFLAGVFVGGALVTLCIILWSIYIYEFEKKARRIKIRNEQTAHNRTRFIPAAILVPAEPEDWIERVRLHGTAAEPNTQIRKQMVYNRYVLLQRGDLAWDREIITAAVHNTEHCKNGPHAKPTKPWNSWITHIPRVVVVPRHQGCFHAQTDFDRLQLQAPTYCERCVSLNGVTAREHTLKESTSSEFSSTTASGSVKHYETT